MNLFVTSHDPDEIARTMDDKRLGKLLMEANQMLSAALFHHAHDTWALNVGPGMLCRISHANHPVSKWVCRNRSTFGWTVMYAEAFAAEFHFRFGKEHDSYRRTDFIIQNALEMLIPHADGDTHLPFQNSARHGSKGIDFTHLEVPNAYRAYLWARWMTDTRTPYWTKRRRPTWTEAAKHAEAAV